MRWKGQITWPGQFADIDKAGDGRTDADVRGLDVLVRRHVFLPIELAT